MRAPAELLAGYYHAVHKVTLEYVARRDRRGPGAHRRRDWDPPVTASARLVSIIDDCAQHLGQAAYVQGILPAGNLTGVEPRVRATSQPMFNMSPRRHGQTPFRCRTILNPATGAVAGEVRWTNPADVPPSPPGCAQLNANGSSAERRAAPRCWPASRCGWVSTAARSKSC